MYRIVIADDEAIECRALEMMIQNDFSELELLPSVANGAELIASVMKNHPDIAIVDINMPELGGLDALELLRDKNQDMKIIISSAYSDFKYLKRAMKLGVADYILKPVEKDAFEETLGKLIQILKGERSKASRNRNTEQQMDEMTQAVGNEFLSSLLLGEPDEKSFQLYRKSLKQEYNGGVIVAVRQLTPEEDVSRDGGRNQHRELLEGMGKQLGKFCSCIGKLYKDEMYFMVLPGDVSSEQSEEKWLEDVLQVARSAGEKQGGVSLSLGVSTRKYDYSEMAAALTECRIAVRTQGRPGIYYYESLKKKTKREDPFEGLGEACFQWIRLGDLRQCSRMIHDAFTRLKFSDEEAMEVQMQILEFILPLYEYLEDGRDYLLRYAKKGRVDFSALRLCKRPEEMEAWVMDSLERLFVKEEAKNRKSREYIERTLVYMEQNFMEDISLDQAAENSGISSFYLSRLLKQELNQTFVEILTDIRMRQALKLLCEKKYTVKEIAKQSGYSNVTYFYKVLKKYTGMNIGEMQACLR